MSGAQCGDPSWRIDPSRDNGVVSSQPTAGEERETHERAGCRNTSWPVQETQDALRMALRDEADGDARRRLREDVESSDHTEDTTKIQARRAAVRGEAGWLR